MSGITSRKTSEILDELQTSLETGLSEETANDRLLTLGRNELKEAKQVSPLMLFLAQFKGVMTILLIVAGIISAITGDLTDTAVIFLVIFMNAILGFTQEFRAEKAISALKKLSVPIVKVIRDGKLQEISSEELVPGDIVKIQAGDLIPADGRLLEAANLTVDEAALTGESMPVEKTIIESYETDDVQLGDRKGDVFRGTMVVRGRGSFVVTATGMNTELGKIADMIGRAPQRQTPLQKRLQELAVYLAIGAVIVCVIVFIAGVIQKRSLEQMLLTSISLAVAAVPESLTAVITICLALGAQRMAKRNALIRKLPAVETLGSVTTICTDKTGTLTQNKMRVEYIYVSGITYKRDTAGFVIPDNPADHGAAQEIVANIEQLLVGMSLCNDTILQKTETGEFNLIGDPTETSLVDAAIHAGIDAEKYISEFHRIDEVPFDSNRKRMTTIHQRPDGSIIAFTKGAIDSVLPLCAAELYNGEIKPLSDERREELLHESEKYAAKGIRVMSGAFKQLDNMPHKVEPGTIERELIFMGFVGISDPLRPEALPAVRKCRDAGIQVKMITGDHKLTAAAIGYELGLISSDEEVCLGADVEKSDGEALTELVNRCKVYARVSPEHKVKIVSALQQNGHVVAMTGDGVNDAPSLKQADVGVAMGITGTDVSREAADIILTDDNFATIVAAVEEGRNIYDNIRKFIRYMLATNLGEVFTMFFGMLLNMPLPLLPIQILWVNLVTDGLPALALGVEPPEGDIMKRPPRAPNESIFARGVWQQIIWVGFFMSIGTLIMFSAEIAMNGEVYARTMAFYTITAFQLFQVMAIRRERELAFKTKITSNKSLLWAIIISFVLQIVIIYVEPFNTVFKNIPISGANLALCTVVASTVFLAVELEKYIRKRLNKL